ncbi:MAG TPA: ketoacyl-ACP synthase III [Candidatus Marinimicrobia bacterium]|nr:ketoacyl-ACP synthase III [Candidatus Neomarinimicrobiota bacterium]
MTQSLPKAMITAMGSYLPQTILTNKELEKVLDTSDEWIYSRTGIRERRIATVNESTSDMAAEAAKDMLDKYNLKADDIDLLIVATVTPDMFFPSTAALVLQKLNHSKGWGFDLSGACSGFLYALSVGNAYIRSGMAKKVAVIGADKMSAITNQSDRNTRILFGDAAAAILLEPSTDYGILDEILYTDGSGKDYLYMPGGGSRNPASHETVEKKMHFIYQDGKTVFKFAVKGMEEVSEKILRKNKLKGSDLTLFIPHQANKRIIDATTERLGLLKNQVLINIDRYANTTAATIPLGICEATDKKILKPGNLLLLAAFGAGFTWGSTLIKWGMS